MIWSEQLRSIPWFASAVVCLDSVRRAVRARARVASSPTSFGNDRSATSVCFGGGFHCRVDADAAFINANTN